MRRVRWVGATCVFAFLLTSSTAGSTGGLFDYDHSAPLGVAFGAKTTAKGVVREDISYQATPSLRLKGYFMHPASGGPWPLVIWSPGAGGDRRQQLPEADRLAHGGTASLLLDAPPFAVPACHIDLVRLYSDYVVSRRRAVDLALTLPNVSHAHLAAAGLSFGAEVTASLAGVEHRLHAFMLESSRAHFTGFVRLLCTSLGSGLDAYAAKAQAVDPVRWIGRAKGALLMQNGTRDQLVTRADVLALYNAAPQPKELRWYVADHVLNAQATSDRVQWLLKQG